MGKEIKPIKSMVKITSPKDNLEYRLKELEENWGVKIGKIEINPKYILSIGNQNREIGPCYKLYLDKYGNPCEIVLKKEGTKYSFTEPNEVKEKYGSFINKARQIGVKEKAHAYEINPAMEEAECLN